jgi:hypothetical protein
MDNYIFSYNGENYITTFGTGYDKHTEKIASLPQDLFPLLIDSISNPVHLKLTSIRSSVIGVNVTGTFVKDNVEYSVDTDNQSVTKINEKQETIVKSPVVEKLPEFVMIEIEESTNNTPNMDLLKTEGDVYCIEHGWHWVNSFYIINNPKLGIRYVHSDAFGIQLKEVPIVQD